MIPSDLRDRIDALKSEMPERFTDAPGEVRTVYASGEWRGERPADWQEREKPKAYSDAPVRREMRLSPMPVRVARVDRMRPVRPEKPRPPRPSKRETGAYAGRGQGWARRADITPEAIMERVAAGDTLVKIAADFGVAYSVVNKRMVAWRKEERAERAESGA